MSIDCGVAYAMDVADAPHPQYAADNLCAYDPFGADLYALDPIAIDPSQL